MVPDFQTYLNSQSAMHGCSAVITRPCQMTPYRLSVLSTVSVPLGPSLARLIYSPLRLAKISGDILRLRSHSHTACQLMMPS